MTWGPIGPRASRFLVQRNDFSRPAADGFRFIAMNDEQLKSIAERLDRLVRLVERALPPASSPPDFAAADAFIWHAQQKTLEPVPRVNRIDLGLLKGIDRQRDILLENTARFGRGL